jgi:hypothetical protein
VALLLLGLPAVVQAQFIYTVDGGAVTIKQYTGTSSGLVIPSTINVGGVNLPVTIIGSYAFYNSVNLTSVTIPNSITNVQSGAFNHCTGLASILIPASVTSIEQEAFGYCTNLIGITVDGANPTYRSLEGVLFDKSQFQLIVFPGGKAGTYAIPNGVTNVLWFAFLGCSRLTRVTLPEGMTSIGYAALYGCGSLTSVAIPDSVTSIGMSAFEECSSLTSITLPNSLTNLGAGAFSSCAKLVSITIPNSVTDIGGWTFGSCFSLASVTIPGSVTNIGAGAFHSCYGLKAVYFKGNAPTGDSSVFEADSNTVYYLPGTTGWGATFGGRPAVLWNPLVPATDATFGVRTNRFGFTITGTPNIPIVVEACSNPASALWISLQSCTLTNGSIYLSDPQWTNYPGRFYRIRSP